MRNVGTVVRGIRTPIIKANDDLKQIVIDSLMNAKESEKFEFHDKDIVAITENADGTYSVDPYVIENNEKKSFELTYNFDFTQYDNSYQNATLTYQLKACAIQTSNLTDPQQALKVLMERFGI